MRESRRPAGPAGKPRTRQPAVAGRFYPGRADSLRAQVDGLLDAVVVPEDEPVAPGYVVPHAGYTFSGPTAAYVYARLRRQADRIRRVILLGPSHYVPIQGCVVPTVDSWLTPLGDVPVDVEAVAALVRDGHARADDAPMGPEHSLEVQLPFLQRLRPEPLTVLPIAVGSCTVDDVVLTLSAALEATGPDTIVLCSTDLSHYLAEPDADAQDERTARAVLELAAERIGARDACGVFALRGLVGYARHLGLRPTLLHRCTSADTAGDRNRVVGYGAFALHAPEPPTGSGRPADGQR
jgi:AmmeMemoRadiSam system protein B